MNALRKLLTSAALLLAISSQAALRPVSELSIQLIPDGYEAGRTDVKYGTYSTVVGEGARAYQDRLLLLGNKAYGLGSLHDDDPAYQSELTYLLEAETLRLYADVVTLPPTAMSAFERDSLLSGTVKLYTDVRHHSERLYEDMIRYIDIKLPGPNGQQIRSEISDTQNHASLYEPNYRSDKDLTPAEKAQAYQDKLKSFLAKGGSLSEIRELTARTFRELPAFSRFEYVWLRNGAIKITEGSAGHLLLAAGNPVKSAGQIVIIRGPQGEDPFVIVTNASGSYKPDFLSTQQFSETISYMFGIPNRRIAVTKGEPISTQAVKIYLKADGTASDAISATAKELEASARRLLGDALMNGSLGMGAPKPAANATTSKTLSWLAAGCAAAFSP